MSTMEVPGSSPEETGPVISSKRQDKLALLEKWLVQARQEQKLAEESGYAPRINGAIEHIRFLEARKAREQDPNAKRQHVVPFFSKLLRRK